MPSQNASGFVRTLQLMPIGLLLPWAIQRGWSPARRGGGAGTARTWARSTWRLGTPAWTRGADTASRPAKRAVGHRHHGIRIPAGKCTSRRRSIASTECPSAGPSARPRTRCLPTHRSCGPARSLRMVSTTGCTPTAAAITGGPVGSPSAMGTASCAR